MHELCERAEKKGIVTSSLFLTPAEQYELSHEAVHMDGGTLKLFGGISQSERKMAFFLPFYITEEDFSPDEYICAVRAETKFGNPGHRDYLGALLGLGIKRESLGDIYIFGETAYFFCVPSVLKHILFSLDKVGRHGVKVEEIPLDKVPAPEISRKSITFTIKSMRLDAAAAGVFSLSRNKMTELIEAGAVSLNYRECTKNDMPVKEGDIISARGYGKAEIVSCGSVSRKGRTFVTAEIYK